MTRLDSPAHCFGNPPVPQRTNDAGFDQEQEPQPLPWCTYPRARDIQSHGLQPLPEAWRSADLVAVRPYRSDKIRIARLANLEPDQILEAAREVARSFALREPMGRHISPPKVPPDGIQTASHLDAFGSASFGPWTSENIIYWFIRLFLLTDPTQPTAPVRRNEDVLNHSIAAVTPSGQVIGAAFSETLPNLAAEPVFRHDDVFLDAVLSYLHPVFELLTMQETAAISVLCEQFPAFRDAYATGRVGHLFMVARSDSLPRDDTFELVAATVEHFAQVGFRFLCIEATNQWTGAACEILGGIRIHFAPFQAESRIVRSDAPLPHSVTSVNGYISDKDSGSMLYMIALV